MPNAEFLLDVEKAIKAYEAANGHPATRTRELIRTYREVEALSRLMVNANLQQGFQVLRDTGQLDKTFESIVVKYQKLFAPDVVEAAKWRLAHAHELL